MRPRLRLWCHGQKAAKLSPTGQLTRSAPTPHSSRLVITTSPASTSKTTPASAATHWAAKRGNFSWEVKSWCCWFDGCLSQLSTVGRRDGHNGGISMFEGQGQKKGGHQLNAVGHQRAESHDIFTVNWKSTLKGTLLCFIYHTGIKEGTFLFYLGASGGTLCSQFMNWISWLLINK